MNLNEAYALWQENPTEINHEIFGWHLYKYVSLLVQKKQDIPSELKEEIVGNSIIKALERLPEYTPELGVSISTFVYRFVEDKTAEAQTEILKLNEYPLSPTLTAPNEYHGIKAKVLLKRLMKELTEDEKAFVKLQLEGYEDQEIADMLEIPIGTVKSRWNRIQEKMRNSTN
jgi:DNA-directed RNA polymerase specialized sigma24 family protein